MTRFRIRTIHVVTMILAALVVALFVPLAFGSSTDQAAGTLTLAAVLALPTAGRRLPEFGLSRLGRPRARVRVRNPIVEGKLYVYRQPQWDVYSNIAGTIAAIQTLFQTPIGQQYTPTGGTAFAKTLYHTSMGVNGGGAGSFPDPEKFFVMGISLAFRSDITVADSIRFCSDVLVDLQIGGRSFAQQHAFRFGQAGGPYSGTSGIITNGIPVSNPENEFRTFGDQGETIEQRQGFKVVVDPTKVIDAAGNTTYTPASSGNGWNAWVFLDGLLYREIL